MYIYICISIPFNTTACFLVASHGFCVWSHPHLGSFARSPQSEIDPQHDPRRFVTGAFGNFRGNLRKSTGMTWGVTWYDGTTHPKYVGFPTF